LLPQGADDDATPIDIRRHKFPPAFFDRQSDFSAGILAGMNSFAQFRCGPQILPG
jgi:hypothetical protein